MSTPKWAALIDKLTNAADPKDRQKACKRLAATRDPEVIPLLRTAYLQDQDERVREAAQEALERFKALQTGQSTRRFPISDRVLTIVLGVLSIVFAISLVLNLVGLLDSDDDGSNGDVTAEFNPTDRTVLVDQIDESIQAAQTLADNLTQLQSKPEEMVCDPANEVPLPLALSAIDQKTYPDLALISNKFDAVLNPLTAALVLLNQACDDPTIRTANVIEAAPRLEQAHAQLDDLAAALQTAIINPAATVGPTVTPLPTRTPIPTATNTPEPPTITPTITITPLESNTPTLMPTSESSPTPTATLKPTATLPFPTLLDYPGILSALRERYVVMADIKSPYNIGMLDQWQKIQEDSTATANCDTLQPWPEVYTLPPDQLTILNDPTVADPMLEDAIQLQVEAMALALKAREAFERDCLAGTLAASAADGIAWSEQALTKLETVRQLVNQIAARLETDTTTE